MAQQTARRMSASSYAALEASLAAAQDALEQVGVHVDLMGPGMGITVPIAVDLLYRALLDGFETDETHEPIGKESLASFVKRFIYLLMKESQWPESIKDAIGEGIGCDVAHRFVENNRLPGLLFDNVEEDVPMMLIALVMLERSLLVEKQPFFLRTFAYFKANLVRDTIRESEEECRSLLLATANAMLDNVDRQIAHAELEVYTHNGVRTLGDFNVAITILTLTSCFNLASEIAVACICKELHLNFLTNTDYIKEDDHATSALMRRIHVDASLTQPLRVNVDAAIEAVNTLRRILRINTAVVEIADGALPTFHALLLHPSVEVRIRAYEVLTDAATREKSMRNFLAFVLKSNDSAPVLFGLHPRVKGTFGALILAMRTVQVAIERNEFSAPPFMRSRFVHDLILERLHEQPQSVNDAISTSCAEVVSFIRDASSEARFPTQERKAALAFQNLCVPPYLGGPGQQDDDDDTDTAFVTAQDADSSLQTESEDSDSDDDSE
ncbi:Hypothetical Protein FCC1311_058182 [Hondaea fermentalgiana]|uniref:Uncharacterized protein n=1 Tax=Hondaea fermentalgiana TaxID=2315210 RepID=A0A2R5GFD6_9STRA|nr:Hypothetical Protein FCC1311_058182 [Hondaea fermentalgiana]|eukprot:GBG29597.1 Hypothetical Protein FCC1311_058182 [Hondaea fermentalgiana]